MTDAFACGRLLRFALSPKLRPSQDPEYAALVARLRSEPLLLAAFKGVLEGAGLMLLAADDYGVVVGCEDDGPFAMNLGDFRGSMSASDRMVYGLLLLAIAAWCFPRAEQLEQPSSAVARVSVLPLIEWLVELCQRLAGQDTEDPVEQHPELRQAWREVLRPAPARPTATGRRSASSLAGMVVHCLKALEGQGLMRHDSDEQGGTWKSTRAYRIQVRELAANAAFRLVRAAVAEGS